MERIKILGYVGPSASRLYRVEQIFKYLNRTDDYECLISPNAVTDEELLWADIVVVQGLVDPQMIATLWAYQTERGLTVIADRDDIVEAQSDNPFLGDHKRLNAVPWTIELLKIADCVTVTTAEIAAEARAYNAHVVIIPNYLDMELWDRIPQRNEGRMLRLGWAGSVTHRDDLAMVLPTIKDILRARAHVQFVVCGDQYLLKDFGDIPRRQWEYIDATIDGLKWPFKAHTLMLDVAIAPLVDTRFNRGRSFLKYLEYAMIGTPGVYSPPAYKTIIKNGKNGFLADTPEDFWTYTTLLLDDPKLRNRIRKEARTHVRREYDVRKHIGTYDKLYRETLQSRRATYQSAR